MPGGLETSNQATVRRLHDAMSGGPELVSQVIDEVVEPDVLFHAPIRNGATGASALKQVMTVLDRAFPDLRVQIDDLIEAGDKVVTRNSVTGTHLGSYLGRPPTGRPVAYSEIFIFRFAGGRIAEIWGVVDVLAQLKQLGAIPA
ncbi:MAG TPA: ester cyclase [Streptosporangiaceae bacterium]|nr:ester cyclase [Streptosporangiaceae bacterium]